MRSLWLNSSERYGWASIVLHWLSVPLVLFLLATGIYMVTLTYYNTLYHTLPQWHKVAGVLVAVLTLLRLSLMPVNPHPALLASSDWQKRAARTAHALLYAGLLVLIVTGYCMTTAEGHPISVFGILSVPAVTTWSPRTVTWLGGIHQWVAYGFGVLVCLHAAAALQHHFFLRDNTLRRMLYPQREIPRS